MKNSKKKSLMEIRVLLISLMENRCILLIDSIYWNYIRIMIFERGFEVNYYMLLDAVKKLDWNLKVRKCWKFPTLMLYLTVKIYFWSYFNFQVTSSPTTEIDVSDLI